MKIPLAQTAPAEIGSVGYKDKKCPQTVSNGGPGHQLPNEDLQCNVGKELSQSI